MLLSPSVVSRPSVLPPLLMKCRALLHTFAEFLTREEFCSRSVGTSACPLILLILENSFLPLTQLWHFIKKIIDFHQQVLWQLDQSQGKDKKTRPMWREGEIGPRTEVFEGRGEGRWNTSSLSVTVIAEAWKSPPEFNRAAKFLNSLLWQTGD